MMNRRSLKSLLLRKQRPLAILVKMPIIQKVRHLQKKVGRKKKRLVVKKVSAVTNI